jgi:hypothetical protein
MSLVFIGLSKAASFECYCSIDYCFSKGVPHTQHFFTSQHIGCNPSSLRNLKPQIGGDYAYQPRLTISISTTDLSMNQQGMFYTSHVTSPRMTTKLISRRYLHRKLLMSASVQLNDCNLDSGTRLFI